MSELTAYFSTTEATQLHGGIVTLLALIFAWMILGRLIDLLLELVWMVWIALTISVTCYLPTVWVYKQSQRVKLNTIFPRKLTLTNAISNHIKMYQQNSEDITEQSFDSIELSSVTNSGIENNRCREYVENNNPIMCNNSSNSGSICKNKDSCDKYKFPNNTENLLNNAYFNSGGFPNKNQNLMNNSNYGAFKPFINQSTRSVRSTQEFEQSMVKNCEQNNSTKLRPVSDNDRTNK